MSALLSICIPTYNRAELLHQLLESIVAQITEPIIEIVVSDNASTDTTAQVVKDFQKRYPLVVYGCSAANEGADANYLRSVALASGEYCWYMGSDDRVEPGAIATVLERIRSKREIYLCDRFDCDSTLKPIRTRHWLRATADKAVFDLHNPAQACDYFERALSIGAVFSYLSSIIFKRTRWVEAPYDQSYTGTLYSHVHKLLSFGAPHCELEYIGLPLVCSRGCNDSFMGEGKIRRFLIDIDGYLKLAATHFANQPEVRRAFLGILVRGHLLFSLKIRVLTVKESQWRQIRSRLAATGFNRVILFLFDVLWPLKYPLRIPVKIIALLRAYGKIA